MATRVYLSSVVSSVINNTTGFPLQCKVKISEQPGMYAHDLRFFSSSYRCVNAILIFRERKEKISIRPVTTSTTNKIISVACLDAYFFLGILKI